MNISLVIQIFLIGVGLSMDAFAVSVCQGLKMKRIQYTQALIIAIFFGGFQAFMPLAGWSVGRYFSDYIERFDHWIAFILLGYIGYNMMKEGMKKDADNEESTEKTTITRLFVLAVATSIDALAVGVTFAFLNYPIIFSIILIGCTTFVLAFAGVCIGNYFGIKYKSRAEIIGGVILIFIGVKILIEHLGILG